MLLDRPHKDLRRACAAAMSMVPTSTGAASAVGLVFPALKGKLDGIAIRLPTSNVSVVDLTANLERDADEAAIKTAMRRAAEGELKGILEYCEEPLVSADFQRQSPLSDLRCAVHQGAGPPPGEGVCLV